MNELRWRFSWRRALILFAIGATLGSMGDLCHVWSGTDGYPDSPWLIGGLGMPIWVPLLFGSSLVAMGESNLIADLLISPYLDPPGRMIRPGSSSPTMLALNSILCMATYAASGFLPLSTGGTKDIVLACAMIATWVIFDRTRTGFVVAVATAAIGFVIENTLSALGAFWYLPHAANVLRVPSWLPLLYVVVAITGGNLARFIAQLELNSQRGSLPAGP